MGKFASRRRNLKRKKSKVAVASSKDRIVSRAVVCLSDMYNTSASRLDPSRGNIGLDRDIDSMKKFISIMNLMIPQKASEFLNLHRELKESLEPEKDSEKCVNLIKDFLYKLLESSKEFVHNISCEYAKQQQDDGKLQISQATQVHDEDALEKQQKLENAMNVLEEQKQDALKSRNALALKALRICKINKKLRKQLLEKSNECTHLLNKNLADDHSYRSSLKKAYEKDAKKFKEDTQITMKQAFARDIEIKKNEIVDQKVLIKKHVTHNTKLKRKNHQLEDQNKNLKDEIAKLKDFIKDLMQTRNETGSERVSETPDFLSYPSTSSANFNLPSSSLSRGWQVYPPSSNSLNAPVEEKPYSLTRALLSRHSKKCRPVQVHSPGATIASTSNITSTFMSQVTDDIEQDFKYSTDALERFKRAPFCQALGADFLRTGVPDDLCPERKRNFQELAFLAAKLKEEKERCISKMHEVEYRGKEFKLVDSILCNEVRKPTSTKKTVKFQRSIVFKHN